MSENKKRRYREHPALKGSRRVTLCAMGALLPIAVIAGPAYDDWSSNVPVLDTGNSLVGGCPIESRDALSMFTASNRGLGTGIDIWVNDRASVDAPFEEANMLPAPINSDADDFCPTPLGGRYFMFVSRRAGGCGEGTSDIYIIRRSPAKDWQEPVNLGCTSDGSGPNGPGDEYSPGIVETKKGTFLYYSTDVDPDPAGVNQDIYVSKMLPDGSFGPGHPVEGINTEYNDQMPTVSADGKEMVYSSNRPFWGGGIPSAGAQDVYYTKQHGKSGTWSEPLNLSVTVPLDTGAASETRASFSWDGSRVNYGSAGEVYVIERQRKGK